MMTSPEQYWQTVENGKGVAGLAGADYANEWDEQVDVHLAPGPDDSKQEGEQ